MIKHFLNSNWLSTSVNFCGPLLSMWLAQYNHIWTSYSPFFVIYYFVPWFLQAHLRKWSTWTDIIDQVWNTNSYMYVICSAGISFSPRITGVFITIYHYINWYIIFLFLWERPPLIMFSSFIDNSFPSIFFNQFANLSVSNPVYKIFCCRLVCG